MTAGKGSLLAGTCDVQVDLPPTPAFVPSVLSVTLVLASCLGEVVVASSLVAGRHRGDWGSLGETGGDWGRLFITRP